MYVYVLFETRQRVDMQQVQALVLKLARLVVSYCARLSFSSVTFHVVRFGDGFRGKRIMLKISVQRTYWLVTTMPSRRSCD